MCKTVFSQVVKSLENQKPLIVKTNNFKWFLYWQNINNEFWASIERESKHEKEQTKIYNNSIDFFNAIQNISKNKNLQLTDTDKFDKVMLK